MRRPGPYQLQALIAGAHADAKSWETTRWNEIVRRTTRCSASPTRRSCDSIARSRVWHVEGPERRSREVDALADELDGYHLFHATRGELLRALGRPDDARAADERALELTENPAERALLRSDSRVVLG